LSDFFWPPELSPGGDLIADARKLYATISWEKGKEKEMGNVDDRVSFSLQRDTLCR
jgi:hypothetical protein